METGYFLIFSLKKRIAKWRLVLLCLIPQKSSINSRQRVEEKSLDYEHSGNELHRLVFSPLPGWKEKRVEVTLIR